MATVLMKWLETRPEDYDRGIQILTLGQSQRVKEYIAAVYVRDSLRVLEIGCGTGALTALMAAKGAQVSAIDASPAMLAQAQRRLESEPHTGPVSLQLLDAAQIGEHFAPASFDLIVSTLVFSEFSPQLQRYVLQACQGLLAPQGRLLVADEVSPERPLARFLFNLLRFPLALFTWLLTRTGTAALHRFEGMWQSAGFRGRRVWSRLAGSLALYEIQAASEPVSRADFPPKAIRRLRHCVTPGTLLLDLWLLFFRILPPYPKFRQGLYAVGNPTPDSPVLVTGNFDLTVRRLVQAIDGQVDAWVLVADSAGINVWCAAGGGYFTAEKIIAAVRSSHLEQVVRHHALILPQLCANGVDGWRIRQETGWGVHWGPAKARDIPTYLSSGRKKTGAMRQVHFPLKDRLEMVTVTLGFYALMILAPVWIFWRQMFWPITTSLLGLSYFYAVVQPWLPGRDGLSKSVSLAVVALTALLIYTTLWQPLSPRSLFHWSIGLIGLSVFTGGELQGMSPLMRGEQANWGWETLIALVLGAVYWLAPLLFGWR